MLSVDSNEIVIHDFDKYYDIDDFINKVKHVLRMFDNDVGAVDGNNDTRILKLMLLKDFELDVAEEVQAELQALCGGR